MCPQLLYINHSGACDSGSCHARPEETPCHQVMYVSCDTQVWWMCWVLDMSCVWCCVSGEVSRFNTDGHLGLRGWPCFMLLHKILFRRKNDWIGIYACLWFLNLPLCTSVCQTSQERAVAHAAWMDRLAPQQIWPEATAHTVDRVCKMWQITKNKVNLWTVVAIYSVLWEYLLMAFAI